MEFNSGILFILGLSVLGGMAGAWFFQKIKIPQVVGYIAIGLLIGKTGFNVVSSKDIQMLYPLNMFALGIIGFLVGGELKIEMLRKYFKQFFAILIGEGVSAFIVVGLSVAGSTYLVIHNLPVAVAMGIVFGAIASATDPASTIDVLWEYRCKGILTSSITAIVALDDALAMTLYGLGVSAAAMLVNSESSILSELVKISIELLGSLALGAVCSGALIFILRLFGQTEKNLAACIGLILLLICAAMIWDMDVILASMTLGFAVANITPRRSSELFEIMRGFSTPIYVLFFVMIGARLSLNSMPVWLWSIVIIYVVGRSAGKIAGAYFGAKLTNSPKTVKNYLGIGLFAQGGVAVGLSLMASERLGVIRLDNHLMLSDAIIFGITATTLIVQILGPPLVKLSASLAGEIGKNITEDDVIETMTVKDVMDEDVLSIPENQPVGKLISVFANNDYFVYPVVDKENKILGTVSLEGVKNVLDNQESWNWLVASDIMEPSENSTMPSFPLKDTINRMRDMKIDQIAIVGENDSNCPAGMLDLNRARKKISRELLKRQEAA